MMNEADREHSVRRRLKECGYVLRKDRARLVTSNHQGGYMIVNTWMNGVARGSDYDCTLEDVEAFADELDASD